MPSEARYELNTVLLAALLLTGLTATNANAKASASDENRSDAYIECMQRAADPIRTEECLASEDTRQAKRLQHAFDAALAMAVSKEKVRAQQEAWLNHRNTKCDVDEEAEGYEIRASIGCMAAMNFARAKELEEFASELNPTTSDRAQQSAPTTEEIQSITGKMYRAYLNGNVAQMMAVEKACWAEVDGPGQMRTAITCAYAGVAGALIEAAYARNEGRGVIYEYRGEVVRDRVMNNKKLGAVAAKEAMSIAAGGSDAVVSGLFAAGMR